jgi:hypothetical protein
METNSETHSPGDPLLDSKLSPWQRPQQRAAEAAAARILASDSLRQACAQVSHLWRLAYGENVTSQAMSRFDDAMAEYCANYVLKAVASDANHPRFVCNFMTPRGPQEQGLFGARMGGDNPDNIYRLAGIAHGTRYRVSGQIRGVGPSNVSFTLVGNYGTSVTIQTVELHQLELDAEGRFSIEIDAEPAGERRHHLRTAPNVKFLFVRDSLSDWSRELPLALHIVRLDPPAAPPIDEAEISRRAVFRMIEEVPLYYWFSRLGSGKPVNTLNATASAAIGGLVTQAGATGHFDIGENEALIVRVDPAGAGYASFVCYDWWFRSLDVGHRLTSRTLATSDIDTDGCVTFVLSAVDPGVANWIDTTGLRKGLMICRWQGLPATKVREGPFVAPIKRVLLSELTQQLPPGLRRVSPAERISELQARERAFQRRYQEMI